MRLQPPRRALSASLALALLSLPLFAAQYSSTSPQELQRRLEQDTNRLIDSLRSQRNSPSRSSSSAGSNSYYDGLVAREARERENRAEQARLDAEWRRDHPNETRQQYFARIDREAAAIAREERRQRDAAAYALRVQREREAAERARVEAAEWARIRASYGGYMAEVSPPIFSSPTESLIWFLRHHNETHNEWAANQAAMLFMEGIGTPQDIPRALRLLDPNGPAAKKAGQRHPETRALFAYLQLTQPDAVKAAGFAVDTIAARRELESAVPKTDLAKWYLARALNTSDSPADQKLALQLITRGAFWARVYFAGFVNMRPAAHDPILKYVSPISLSIVEKQRAHIPTLIRELPMSEFENFDDLLPYVSEPLRTQAMTLYAEAVAERAVPSAPATEFNFYAFNHLLGLAGEAGIDSVYGLAALYRFHLLEVEPRGPFKPSWAHFRDTDRTLAALTRWAAREDVLGARARLAIEGLATEAVSSQWWTPPHLPEVADYHDASQKYAAALKGTLPSDDKTKSIFQIRDEAEAAKNAARPRALAAIAQRDASAPKISTIPGLIASMQVSTEWLAEVKELKASASGKLVDPATFAVTHASFDLAQAEMLYDAALAPETPEIVRRHTLFKAMRAGDAFAPSALLRELRWELLPPVTQKLERLASDRLARDQAARRPRALLAHAIMELFRLSDDATPALTEAAAAGSPLAARLLLNRRIGDTIARENGRPISWNLDPSLIAEYDAALASGKNTGPEHAEWSVVRVVFSESEADTLARNWFNYLQSWIADRDERRVDAAFAGAIGPQIDAVIATLAEWPGLNQDDPLRAEWAEAATRDREQARQLVTKNDGLGALRAFLAAAGRGDRGALELLARHIRNGDGGLPHSPEIADRLQAAAFKMTLADAEVGDAFAANYIGECYREGTNGIAPDPSQALAWLRYAADLGSAPAARTLAQADASGLNRTPADILHWTAVREACEYSEYLPKPPRRLTSPRLDLTAVRPQLEAAVTALNSFRSKKSVELTSEQEDAEMLRTDTAKDELKKNPTNGLVLLAQIAASGNRYVAHDIARILSRGDYGVQPEPALAKRFHAAGLAILERDAEYGDIGSAHRLGLYALALAEKPDISTALRWLTYSAELGNSMTADFLAQLYTNGAPGLPADPAAAARWTAFAESTNSENFKPRDPLRK